MVNYSNSIIYKLCCNDTDVKEIYIGSTTSFRARKSGHKTSCCNPNDKGHSYSLYKFIRENGGWENWCMIQIEQYNAQDKRELLSKERYWIEQLKPALNKDIPGRTSQEYYQDNKEIINRKTQTYKQLNREKIRITRTKYKQLNQERICMKNKEYRDANKERIAFLSAQKIECNCGGVIRRDSLSKHKKSKHHLAWEQLSNFIHS
jgi:hypothetical protein